MSDKADIGEAGFQHQCRTPPVWFARLIGSRAGREWVCKKCGCSWTLTWGHIPYHHGAALIEWRSR